MIYKIFIERSAQKSLSKIPNPNRNRIIESISGLSTIPRPQGAKKLTGRDAWRIRVGNYRIIYEIHDDKVIILIVKIGHRRDVYKRLP